MVIYFEIKNSAIYSFISSLSVTISNIVHNNFVDQIEYGMVQVRFGMLEN